MHYSVEKSKHLCAGKKFSETIVIRKKEHLVIPCIVSKLSSINFPLKRTDSAAKKKTTKQRLFFAIISKPICQYHFSGIRHALTLFKLIINKRIGGYFLFKFTSILL
jgi:hypothetical protein